ncbi:hypothetical protein DOY81_009098 [Sarcophaga bullata]|nr:hypothetical protein DOY81_009098 [Sarcophaga bullata]
MVVTSDIQFENNPNAIFYAGQVINGKVTLTADKLKQVKAVVLKITGCAETRWSESRGTGDQRKTTTYSGKEDYINSVTYLMSPTTSDQSVVIEPGIHTFSFACHLPANCPSSFESITGNIRYIVQVNLERPWKFDQKFTKAFTVLNVMNLNYNDSVLAVSGNQV